MYIGGTVLEWKPRLRLRIKGKVELWKIKQRQSREKKKRGKKSKSRKKKEKVKRELRAREMRPLFDVQHTAISGSSTSNSDPTDRRINALVRHLVQSSSSAMADSLSASATSSLQSDSVFAHVVRAPEDPILGVISLSLSLSVSLCLLINRCRFFFPWFAY